MHPIVTEMPGQFIIPVLPPLRVEAEAPFAEVVVNTEAIMFAPAILTPVRARFDEISDMNVPSRIHRCKIARRFNDGVERDGERFPKKFLHVNDLI